MVSRFSEPLPPPPRLKPEAQRAAHMLCCASHMIDSLYNLHQVCKSSLGWGKIDLCAEGGGAFEPLSWNRPPPPSGLP